MKAVAGAAALITACAGPAVANVAEPPQLEFAVRADLSVADAIALVLARTGRPVLYPVPDGTDPAKALAEICGVPPPAILGTETRPTEAGRSVYVRAAPCVRRLHNVVAIARDGDTLETIAVRFGMRPSASRQLRVQKKAVSPFLRSTKTLARGDRVVAPVVPDWSVIRPIPGTVTSRMDLVQQIAIAMNCGAEDANSCLLRRSVLVTDRTPSASAKVLQSRADAQDQPPGPSPAVAAPLQSAVAAGQWPYDAELVRMLLKEAAETHTVRPALIGIAENGLNDATGKPLAAALFGRTYETELIGGGAPRNGPDRDGTTDVSLCPKAPDTPFASWPPPGFEEASHGAIVASIATGSGLRSDATAATLPKLLFYRTLRDGCTAAKLSDIKEDDLVNAAELLISNDIKVLNISAIRALDEARNLESRLGQMMDAQNAPVLVVAAGNFTGDVDSQPVCPACLGNADRSGKGRHRVIAVGAADRMLRRADYSGHGSKTVRLYAPAEPTGAVDIDGQDASAFKGATSYATPLVSLAAGIAYALGMDDAVKVRNRLMLSTWPLLDGTGKPVGTMGGTFDIGVLDLVRVAGLRHTVVEALQAQSDGSLVRRTYVGKITGGLNTMCAGTAIDLPANQAVRFGDADQNGLRDTTITRFLPDNGTNYPPIKHIPCASSGSITISALRDGIVSIPALNVSQILFPVPLH